MSILAEFQPQDGTGTTLEWRVFAPTNGSTAPWPIVILLHEGHFAGGSFFGGTLITVAEDVAREGYYVLVPSFRAAPCGLIKNQPIHDNSMAGIASGRPPEQTNDIKALVRAARADLTNGTGKVGVVGGSKAWTIPDSSEHGYAYWNSPICDIPGQQCNPSTEVRHRGLPSATGISSSCDHCAATLQIRELC